MASSSDRRGGERAAVASSVRSGADNESDSMSEDAAVTGVAGADCGLGLAPVAGGEVTVVVTAVVVVAAVVVGAVLVGGGIVDVVEVGGVVVVGMGWLVVVVRGNDVVVGNGRVVVVVDSMPVVVVPG